MGEGRDPVVRHFTCRARIAPFEAIFGLHRFPGIGFEPAIPNGQDVAMRQPVVEQRADHIAHAASFMEMVHVARPVGVNARYQRHGAGQL